MPASLAYWPRRDWALIGIRRRGDGVRTARGIRPEELAKWEIRGVVPDGR